VTPKRTAPVNRFGWAPFLAVGVTVLLQILTLAFTFGVQTAKLQMIDQRVQRIEQMLMERGARAER
jgi:H+/gluconate symporter-like permease